MPVEKKDVDNPTREEAMKHLNDMYEDAKLAIESNIPFIVVMAIDYNEDKYLFHDVALRLKNEMLGGLVQYLQRTFKVKFFNK